MDFKNLIESEMGAVLKKLPPKVQADMNVFIQEIGENLTKATESNEDVDADLFALHQKTKEKLKNTINEHNKMQSNHGDSSNK